MSIDELEHRYSPPAMGVYCVNGGHARACQHATNDCGAQQGYVRTLPFIAGLIVGKLGLNLLMALGLSGFLWITPCSNRSLP